MPVVSSGDHLSQPADGVRVERASSNLPVLPEWPSNRRSTRSISLSPTSIAALPRYHSLTVARHPSETDERMMVRLIAFALHSHERLELGQRMNDTDEPDLLLKDLTGAIEIWIDVGQPDEARLRKACGRAKHVFVHPYSGHAAQKWWEESSAAFSRFRNLTVTTLGSAAVQTLGKLAAPKMSLQFMI